MQLNTHHHRGKIDENEAEPFIDHEQNAVNDASNTQRLVINHSLLEDPDASNRDEDDKQDITNDQIVAQEHPNTDDLDNHMNIEANAGEPNLDSEIQ